MTRADKDVENVCGNCQHSEYNYTGSVKACACISSDHFGHYITDDHPACKKFVSKAERNDHETNSL